MVLFLSGSLFEIIISYHYLLIIWQVKIHWTWADLSRTLSNHQQLFAALT